MKQPAMPPIDRRTAIKWMLTASASAFLWDGRLLGAAAVPTPGAGAAHGYGTDPDLLRVYRPGELWPLTLTPAQRRTTAALSDLILPAEGEAPGASEVGVPDFIDEWISAPYETQAQDRVIILDCLTWVEAESRRRFGLDFADCVHAQATAICDDIHDEPTAAPAFKKPARDFGRFRSLVIGGYYTTPEGMKDAGYVGNVPLAKFEGPPPDLLRKLGILA